MGLNIDQIEFFKRRHNGIDDAEKQEMLKAVGVKSIEELIAKTIPANIRLTEHLDIAPAVSEQQFIKNLRKIASKNKVFQSFIGMGYYNTITPNVSIWSGTATHNYTNSSVCLSTILICCTCHCC